jgi:hypothetical protein
LSDLATNEEIQAIRKLLQDSALSRAEDALSLLDRNVRLSYFEQTLEHMTRIYSIRAGLAIDGGRGHMGWPELAEGLKFQLAAEPSAKIRLYSHILSEAEFGNPLLIFTNSTTTKLLGILVGPTGSGNQTTFPLTQEETELAGN